MSPPEKDRYSRQILFPPIGAEGQARLLAASVCVVGCGALGSFQAESLVRAGVGRLRLIDRDYVDYTNLQRQWLYDESDAENESPKALAASRRLSRLNHSIQIEPLVTDLTPSNAEDLIDGCDLILDGTDNFETRYLLNDLSVKRNIPWVYGAAIGSYGITIPFLPGAGPCFMCIYPEPPKGLQPTCDVSGILSSATASVAALQASMAMRFLVGWPDFKCKISTLDSWLITSRQIDAGPKDAECPACVRHEFKFLEQHRRVPVSLCGRNAVQLHESTRPLNLSELAHRLEALGPVRVNEFALRMRMDDYDLMFFPDGRAIVKGTTDIGVARSIYARLIGS
jgi:molybdopterin-synthase adenylyltransferase